jgi:hypothetical protein
MNLQTVLVDGVLDGQDNLSNKLPNVILLDWDLLEKYGGKLERNIIVGDMVQPGAVQPGLVIPIIISLTR